MVRTSTAHLLLALLPVAGGCGNEDGNRPRTSANTNGDSGVVVEGPWNDPALAPDALERGRLDPSWREVVQIDSATLSDSVRSPETWEDLSAAAVNRSPTFLPLYGDVSGPSVLRVQVLLDRALFSPGIMDGRWGKNTEKAVYWLQRREGLPATGQVDSVTFQRLAQLAGRPGELIRVHRLTAEDVKGPFVEIPEDIYEAAELDCTCYGSLAEKLGEQFHVIPELLAKLNPGVDLNALAAGDRLFVPAVLESDARAAGEVAEIVVSVRGHYLHANDVQGRLLYHFPTTLGSGYDPKEGRAYRITSITEDPWWLMQPRLLHTGDPNRPNAKIPPGPNNAVGVMWMALSKPHYGIHGTAEPQTIGYASSSGCVRLTHWDALFLGDRVEPGIPVRFRDIPPGRRGHPDHGAERASG
jgi:lipoprotein-anchoring transpeptidase ErfK/SrfK